MKSILGIGNALTDILAILPDDSLLRQYHLPTPCFGGREPSVHVFFPECLMKACFVSGTGAGGPVMNKTENNGPNRETMNK